MIRRLAMTRRASGSARALVLATAAVLATSGLAALTSARADALGAPSFAAAAAPALWPANPDWQRDAQAPASRHVHPVRVVSTAGQVSDAAALTDPGGGQSATLTRTAADTGPTDIVLDYGKDVGGLPKFTVSGETGSPAMQAGYSEALRFLTPTGDGGTPFGSGDPSPIDS